MPGEQIGDIAPGLDAFAGIAGAEPDNIASQIGTNAAGPSAKQFNQVGPRLTKLVQQGFDPAARRFSFVLIVRTQLAEEFGKALALALAEPSLNSVSRHGVTPSHLCNYMLLNAIRMSHM